MDERLVIDGADHGNVVGMRAQVLEQVRDLQARFPALAELAAAAHQLRIRPLDELQVETVRAEAGRQGFPVETG